MKLEQNTITALDNSGMGSILIDFHQQIRNSIKKVSHFPKLENLRKINKIVIFGMGGSAISGDLARNYISVNHHEIDLPITIIRNYNIPVWVDENTLAIAISYSGNTEETLSCFAQAAKVTKNLIAISSGGQIKEICNEHNIPFLEVPGGFQPRAALGYLFTTITTFLLLNFCKICEVSKATIEFQILADYLEMKGKEYSVVSEDNFALEIAQEIAGKTVVIYSSSDVLDVVNLRWRGQIQENSKNLAFGNLFPEMNHNEINSYMHPEKSIENLALIFLSDKADNPKVFERILATKEILSEKCKTVLHLEGQEDIFLVRLFDLIYLADWVSYYLAILNNEDPTPIPLISKLKKIMSGI
ncbi:MAG: bifunctional phosphoglucose/phosphomannose isomerase [Ignavibacteria bacterium GWF2_33_9]|nr:MAG: bifunctional phosphoglucose/phosphomannose isomerase [Ignavibacteria bacterium GWF2_33_9]